MGKKDKLIKEALMLMAQEITELKNKNTVKVETQNEKEEPQEKDDDDLKDLLKDVKEALGKKDETIKEQKEVINQQKEVIDEKDTQLEKVLENEGEAAESITDAMKKIFGK